MALRSKSLWKWEAAAILSSLVFLFVMVVLLLVYNDKPIWDRRGITLNAVVSILATVSKALMMFAIGEAIGQWKWLLFAREPHPLLDLEYVDAASRGPLGSAKVLWPTRKFSFMRLGAIVTVLALALDPFAQQLVQYSQRNRDISDIHTTISRAQRYSRGKVTTQYPSGATAQVDFSMESAILYGLVHQYDTVSQQLPFTCATGNCTWQPYESLAVCSVCNDLTSQLTSYSASNWLYVDLASDFGPPVYSKNFNGTTFELPNGLSINNEDGVPYLNDSSLNGLVNMTTYGSGNASKTVSLKDYDSLIWAMSLIKMSTTSQDPWPRAPVEAFECGLYYCVNRYESKVDSGTLYEVETAVDASRDPQSWQPILSDGYYNGVQNLSDAEIENIEFDNVTWTFRTDLMLGDQYNVSQAAIDGISSYFQQTFKTKDVSANDTERQDDRTDANLVTVNGYVIDAGYSPRSMQVFYETPSLNDTFKSLAKSMSNSIRADADNTTLQTGTSQVMTTYYHIVWPWIALHAGLSLAAIAFLLITIRQTSHVGVPAWKSHSLAPLSRSAEIGDVLVGVESLADMEQRASRRIVQFFGKTNYQRLNGDASEMVTTVTPRAYNKVPRATD